MVSRVIGVKDRMLEDESALAHNTGQNMTYPCIESLSIFA